MPALKSRASLTSWSVQVSPVAWTRSPNLCANWSDSARKAICPEHQRFSKMSAANFRESRTPLANSSKHSSPPIDDLMKRVFTPARKKTILIVDDDQVVGSHLSGNIPEPGLPSGDRR